MSYDKVAVLEGDIKNQKGNIEDLKIQVDQLIEERNRYIFEQLSSHNRYITQLITCNRLGPQLFIPIFDKTCDPPIPEP